MLAVADELRAHLLVLDRGRDDAGLAVVDAGHGIIQVRQVRDTCFYGADGIVIGRVRVRDGDGALLACLAHKFRCTGQLRCDVHDADDAVAGGKELAERLKVRLAEIGGVLCALFLLAEERPLHMRAAHDGAARGALVRHAVGRGKGRSQRLIRQGQRRGGNGGDAVPGTVACHADIVVPIAVGVIRAGIAVRVDIEQAGDDIGAVQIDGVRVRLAQHTREAAVFHGEGPVLKAEFLRIDHCIAKLHGYIPPAGLRRACAAPADWPPPRTGRRGAFFHPAA